MPIAYICANDSNTLEEDWSSPNQVRVSQDKASIELNIPL